MAAVLPFESAPREAARARARQGFAFGEYREIIIAVAFYFLLVAIGLNQTLIGVGLGQAISSLPPALIVLVAALKGFDWRLYRAAASLGASPWRVTSSGPQPLSAPSAEWGLCKPTRSVLPPVLKT